MFIIGSRYTFWFRDKTLWLTMAQSTCWAYTLFHRYRDTSSSISRINSDLAYAYLPVGELFTGLVALISSYRCSPTSWTERVEHRSLPTTACLYELYGLVDTSISRLSDSYFPLTLCLALFPSLLCWVVKLSRLTRDSTSKQCQSSPVYPYNPQGARVY